MNVKIYSTVENSEFYTNLNTYVQKYYDNLRYTYKSNGRFDLVFSNSCKPIIDYFCGRMNDKDNSVTDNLMIGDDIYTIGRVFGIDIKPEYTKISLKMQIVTVNPVTGKSNVIDLGESKSINLPSSEDHRIGNINPSSPLGNFLKGVEDGLTKNSDDNEIDKHIKLAEKVKDKLGGDINDYLKMYDNDLYDLLAKKQ